MTGEWVEYALQQKRIELCRKLTTGGLVYPRDVNGLADDDKLRNPAS